MAKILYFRSIDPTVDRCIKTNNKAGTGQYWVTFSLSESAGAAVVTGTATSVTGPTNGLEAGTSREWLSEPLAADYTISGTITVNLYGLESNAMANAALGVKVERVNCTDNSLTTIADGIDDAELGTAAAEMVWTLTPTSTACNKGDRIRVTVYFDDAPTLTMATGYTLTFRYNYNDANTADSWIQFNENLTFQTFSGTQYIYPTNTASDVSTADVDYEAWTSRGGGVQTTVRNTSAGPVTAPGLQWTETAGGTTVTWWTPKLLATTLSGMVQVQVRAAESNALANCGVRCEIARVDSDGSNATVWGVGDALGEFGTSEGTLTTYVSGDDLSISDQQRLRIRFYVVDNGGDMATSYTATMYYNGASGATGDTFLYFPITLEKYTTNLPVDRASLTISGTSGPVGDEGCSVTSAALSVSGSSVIGDESVTVTSTALSVVGTTLSLERMADPATLSITGQQVVLDESCTVTSASPSLAGSTITFALGKDLPVASAALSVTGQTVVQDFSFTVGNAALTLAGSTDLTLDLGGGSNTDFPFDQAALQPVGQAIPLDEGCTAGSAALSTSGSSVALDEGATVTRASLTISGQAVILDESVTVTSTGLTVSGQAVVQDEALAVGSRSLSITGQTVDLSAGRFIDVTSTALSIVGTTLTRDKMYDPAALSVTGQSVDLVKTTGFVLNVDHRALSITGTTLTREVMADKASLSLSGQNVELFALRGIVVSQANLTIQGQSISGVFGLRYLTVDPTALSIQPQAIVQEQAREFDEGHVNLTGSSFTAWDFGLLVTNAALSLAGSTVTLFVYSSASLNVTSTSLVIATQDVTMPTTQQPPPDLEVEQANLTLSGQNVTLERSPLNVTAASLTIQGTDMLMTPIGLGHSLPVDAAELFVNGEQDLTYIIAGSFALNVSPAAPVLNGNLVGTFVSVYGSNAGTIDGAGEYVIDTAHGGVLLYPKGGGYHVIAS